VLDKRGYGVLVDFGIAKYVEGLTYTFCGTPDYLSPEIIRCTGHNWAVDYWALGIFLFEMTKGAPPFRVNGRRPIEREKKILKGFDLVNVPQYFTSGLTDLISRLLITDQTKRLGRTQNGVQGIKNHRWFAGFDWEGFENQSINAPLIPRLPQDIKEIGNVMDSRLKQEVDATPYSDWWPDLTLDLRLR
jgi:serine/threonine protein kinase